MSEHGGAWFAERLEVARGNPPHDFHANCPHCASRDNLHVTDGDGGAVAYCFGCEATTATIIELLDGEQGAVTITKTPVDARDLAAEAGPLAWWADHCSVPRSFLAYLPLSADGGHVAFTFDGLGVRKVRRAGTKDFAWQPAKSSIPPLWPIPLRQMPATMILTEGEADATVVAFSVVRSCLDGIIAVHSVTNPSAATATAVWRELARRGLEHLLVLFDDDEKQEKAAAENIANAIAAGLSATRAHLEGIDPLLGEKDARDVWRRLVAAAPEPGDDVQLDLAESDPLANGARLLSDVDGAPPPDLVLGLIDPEGHTIIYGQGDSGKGVISSYLIAQLTQRGDRVLIADFEGHPNEWRRRVAGHGGDLDQVLIVEPNSREWHGERGALWDVAPDLAAAGSQFGATYLVVDSITTASGGLRDPYSQEPPQRYGAALQQIGLTAISLAHVTKSDDNPAYPFGSIHWHTQARTTWSLEDRGGKRVLEHRKKGNRPWQGKLDVAINFDDVNGTMTTTMTPQAGATPSVRKTGQDARTERQATAARDAAANLAPAPADAVSKNTLAGAMGKGSKNEKLDGIDLAIERGWIERTPEGRYWSNGPHQSTGPLGPADVDRSNGPTPVDRGPWTA